MSPEAKDLIQNLLQTKPSERFGTHGADDIKSHPWFKGVDFEQLLARQVDPPYTPDLKFEGDTRCFAYYEEMHIPYNMIQTNQPYCDHFAYF
jgi:protein kinase A